LFFAGIKSTDDSTFFIQSSGNNGNGDILEEMCETLILAIVMILWEGVVESDEAAWMVCYLLNLTFSVTFSC